MFSKDSLHLWILFGALVLGGVGYASMRSLVVPASYGKFGPYRGDALTEEMARAGKVTTKATCIACHEGAAAKMAKSKHSMVHCSDCHGQGKEHIAACDLAVAATKAAGGDVKTVKCLHDKLMPTQLRQTCLHCHSQTVGRASTHPQIVVDEHLKDQDAKDPKSANVCSQCHAGHNPGEEPETPADAEEADEDEKPAAAPAEVTGAQAAIPATPAAADQD